MSQRTQPCFETSPKPVFPQISSDDGTSECDVSASESTPFDDIITEELNQASPPSFDEDREEGLSEGDDLHWFRFGGVGRLYEDDENPEEVILERLKSATVAVIGMGGTSTVSGISAGG